MRELGLVQSNAEIVRHYGELLDGMVVDTTDAHDELDLPTRATTTFMKTLADRETLARTVLDFARELT